jgi:predicted dehydrogenase
MSDTKIGVVGGGNWGKNHIRTLHEMGALGAVVELDEGLRESLASEHPDVAIYDSLETVLAGGEGIPDCAGFVTATPAHVHYPIGIQCLEAGKGVLIEKPMTLDSAESEKLVDAAKAAGQILMVGHLLLFQPAVQAIKKYLDSGELGTLHTLHQVRSKLGRARAVEDVMWSFGVHDLAVLLYLTGEGPSRIQAMGHAGLQPDKGISDDVHLQMEFGSGAQAYLHNSWLWPQVERRLVVVGSRGMLVYDELSQTVTLHKKTIDSDLQNVDEGEEEIFQGAAQPLQLELEHFISAIETGECSIADGQNGLDVVRVLEEAAAQLK